MKSLNVHFLRKDKNLSQNLKKPKGFCDWAWNDIYKFVAVLLSGGNFSKDHFEGWMIDDKTMIACCTDAIRSVNFKIERID